MTKPGYKQTEIGEIPEEWEVVKLGDLCDVQVGKTPSRDIKAYWDEDKKTQNRWATIADLLNNKIIYDTSEYLSDKAIEDTKIKRVSAGTLLMSFKLTVGRIAFAGVDIYTNEAIAALLPRNLDKVSTNYLYYALWHVNPESYCDPAVKGKTLNQPKIKSILVQLPPLPEQKKIASVLSTVDEAIQQTNEIIAQAKQVKKGLMQELLTRGIGHKKFKQTEIGEIPEEWEVVKIANLAETKSGGTPSTAIKAYWQNGTIPWINSGELKDSLIKKPTTYITQEASENSAAKVFPKDSVLIALTGATTGKVGILTFNSSVNQSITAIFPSAKYVSEYLFYYLIKERQRILSHNIGAAQPHINKGIVDNLEVSLPPLPEQKKIAEILSAADAKIEAEIEKKKQLETLKKGLMQDLLTGRVRFPEFVKGANS